jgi:hypothetical protein
MKAITLITTSLVLSGSILSIAKAAPPSDSNWPKSVISGNGHPKPEKGQL